MSEDSLFVVMVFLVGFLLVQSFISPLMGSSRQSQKRLRTRIRELSASSEGNQHQSLVRERYLRDLSPLEQRLMALPGMDQVRLLTEQAGLMFRPYRFLLLSSGTAITMALVAAYFLGWGIGTLLISALGLVAPFLLLKRKRERRLAKFEEQLPDALTIAARALRAGLPFTEALHLVSEEMQEPISKEFGAVFTEINYGGDVRSALLGILERVPSVAVMAMVSSILIQRETGGNLAEILDKISGVVRQRFRFQRTLRTLTAEGRLSAWILSLLPFFMVSALALINPDFVPMLTKDPSGREMVLAAFALMVLGILWLRRIVRIDV